MKKRIYIYELDCYKVASEEQIQRMRISPERYFNLEGLPSEELAEKLEEFIWERGKMLAPSSMASEVTYYNNIREFLIDRKIQSLDAREEEKIIRMLKGWMLERGYALSSKKYRPAYDKIGIESPSIVRHMKKILKFLEEEDGRDEQEKDIWTLKNFDFPIYRNPIKNTETINFTKIVQPDIREEEGDLVTSIVNHKDCVFTCYDEKGYCYCAIEKAFRAGKTDLYKPISCHLYPIRIGDYGPYKAVNYHRWNVCKAAVLLGQKENLPVYKFLKEPLVRKFGEEWYKELEIAAEELQRRGMM